MARSLRGSSPPLRFGSVQVKAVSTNVRVFGFPFGLKRKSSFASVRLGKISSLAMRMIWRERERKRELKKRGEYALDRERVKEDSIQK